MVVSSKIKIENQKGFGFEESKKVRCLANRMLAREKMKRRLAESAIYCN